MPLYPDATDGLIWSAEQMRVAATAAGIVLWSWNVDTDDIRMDERGYALWGVQQDEPLTFELLSTRIQPPDLRIVKAILDRTRSKPGSYEIDFRIHRGDGIRWISARGLGADEGIVGRIMFGIFLDATERKLAEEAREMLAGEMGHRVKNLFAIASSLTAIAARSAVTTTEMARDLTQRLSALASAHDLIRPSAGHGGHTAALLQDLFAVFLAPYDTTGVIGGRINVSLPDVRVGESSATTLALVVHELATNSAKYGALSVASGLLDVTCKDHNGDLAIVWAERNGPPVSAPTGQGGFGSKLISQSVKTQLFGSVAYDWQGSGVVITLRMSKGRLAS